MDDVQFTKLVEVLERIAAALEKLGTPALAPLPAPAPARPYTNMWQCPTCKGWYMVGTTHACTGTTPPYTGGPFVTGIITTAGSSYRQCNKFGPNGGRCYLQEGHTSACVFVTITNNDG